MQVLNDLLVSFLIAPWEATFYAILVGAYTLMGLYKSCLVTTFVFIYYWGFRNLLQIPSSSGGPSEAMIILYVLSGLAILGLVILNYLSKHLRRA